MIVVEILIPLTSNEGAAFTAEHHRAFETNLIAVFGGFSLLPGTVRGGWEADGVCYGDETRVYAVALGSIADGGDVGEVIAIAKTHYGQLAIFIRYLGLAEVL